MSEFSSELRTVGHHFVVGLSGQKLDPREARLLRELHPTGIILFANNVDKADPHWMSKLSDLIRSAKDTADNPDLLVSIDHEGGKVNRLPAPITHFPPAQCWGEECEAVARAMAHELLELGINLSYAPVLDIHSEPTNPVIGVRAFGTDPEVVANAGIVSFQAQEEVGVLACGKHFPGHGATTSDSHFTLPVLDLSLDAMRHRELIPFQRAINSGLGAIMTAHVVYPQIDANLPATLSPRIITGLLREELGFSGVTFTDALDMRAMEHIQTASLSRDILLAGGDILLVAKPLPWRSATTLPIVHGCELGMELLRALDGGSLPTKVVELSRERITRFTSRRATLAPSVLTPEERLHLANLLRARTIQ